MKAHLLIAPLLALSLSAPLALASIQLTGANGRSVEFAGIWEARTEGLVVLTTAESDPIIVTWDKFDLTKLKAEQPAIETARQRAVFLRATQPVNLGLFADILTASQVGTEIRRILDVPSTVKVPLAFRTTTETVMQAQLVTIYPTVWDGLVMLPPVTAANQSSTTKTETRQITPDEITTTPRRVLTQLSRTEGVLASDRRALFELNKVNPKLLEEAAQALERIRASLPPKRLLANDPTLQTLDYRLTEAVAAIRDIGVGQTINRAQQDRVREFLNLADHPALR